MENQIKYKSGERLLELDALKGISILFIVMIHSLSESVVDLRNNLPLLSKLSDSFALCLFFLVSGFLYNHDATPIRYFFKKKVCRFLYPYLFFATADIVLRFLFSSITSDPHNSDLLYGLWRILTGQVYWFLYSMFLILIVNRFFYRIRWWLFIVCLIVSLIGLPDISEFTVSKSLYYNIWFCLGYAFRQRYDDVKHLFCSHYGVFITLFGFAYVLMLLINNKYVSQFLLPLAGCTFIWCLCLKLTNSKLLLHFGKYSMQYYTIHLLICFPFYFLGAWMVDLTDSYLLGFLAVYITLIFTTYVCLLIEKRVKFMYLVWGL